MRIFISSIDLTGTKRTTRLNIHNCTSTSHITRQICKELSLSRKSVTIKLKAEPFNLIIVQNWDIQTYPIRNGSIFIVQIVQSQMLSNMQLSQPLQKIIQEQAFQDQGSVHSSNTYSPTQIKRRKLESRFSLFFEEHLNKMLEKVREGNLAQISQIMKEQPCVEDQEELTQILKKKTYYLVNQIGDCGRNALHWAIHISRIDVVSFLLIKGANPNILTIDQYSPLQLAVVHHSPDILDMLLNQHAIDVNQITNHGSALHLAVRNQDVKCLEILLRCEASIDSQDKSGKTPIQICKNEQISKILNHRAQMGKLITPNIVKGTIYRVSQTTKRLKERNMQINPFKGQYCLYETNGELEERMLLQNIQSVQQIEEKSWLMKSSMFYFKLTLRNDQKGLTLAVNHNNIGKRWIYHLQTAIKYLQFSKYVKPISVSDQVIEILDDVKGQSVRHKRKIEEKSSNKSPISSVMNLKEEDPIAILTPKKNLKTTEETQSNRSNQENKYKESEIVLGSVLDVNRYSNASSQNITPFDSKDLPFKFLDIPDKTQANRFRKNSDYKIEEVSEYSPPMKVVKKISYIQFDVQKLLGNGAFGKVYLAKYRQNGKKYALKVLNKKKLFVKKQLKYAIGETNILKKVDSPFIVKLYYAFQTPSNIYMALDHCPLGDLAELILAKQHLHQKTAKFVIAQLVLAIEYLHRHGILYRDLKPENILIDADGYIKLTDFGLSRQNNFATSFCGSPAYLSPQMLQKKGVGTSSDIYGIGCVLYEMVVGQPPYFSQQMETLFQNIRSGKLRFPSRIKLQLKSLITKLLQRDLSKRLGVKDIDQIKRHDFFKDFDWYGLQRKKLQVPFEMFTNSDETIIDGIKLQVKDNIQLVDHDYNQQTGMMNRIKNFTFIREEDDDDENIQHVQYPLTSFPSTRTV